MAFQLSPGVNVSEIDLTTIVPAVATSVGAFAGPFAWGPTREIVTISDEIRLADRFGKPNANNFEYWFTAANFLAYSNNLRVVRAANTTSTLNATANGATVLIENEDDYENNHEGAVNTTFGPFAARWPGALGNSLRVSMCPSANAFASNVTAQHSHTANALNILVDSTTVLNVDASGGANIASHVYPGDLISVDGGSSFKRVSSVNATAIVVATSDAFTANVTVGTAITRKWQYADNLGTAPSTSDFVASRGGSGDEMHVIVIDEDGLFTGSANTVLERFSFVSKASDAKDSFGNTNFYKNVINQRSNYVWWMTHQPGALNWGNTSTSTFTSIATPFSASLTAGADGTIGNAELITAYDKFADADSVDVSLIVSGPADQTLATSLISNIAERRKDCLVFLSPQKSDVVYNAGNEASDIIQYRDSLTSTSYAVMDSNWKYQFDKYNDTYRWIPMNGDVAGLCVRTDLERDPWFSPGGLNRGIIKNVIKLAWSPSKANRDDLYVKGINPIVSFPGEGTVLFGDKTLLAKPSAFDRINVRRLFIVIEKAIARAARFSLFEFNDQFTRAQFVNLVEPYLRDVAGRRGITDFRVVCDETNNTQEIIDRNEFIGDIYIKPVRSINFIQLNFVAVRSGVSFEEVVGQF
jgi:phage tail sheath protein FI